MRELAIRVRGLGKRYELGANAGMFRYSALRDAMAETAGRWMRRAAALGSGARDTDLPQTFWAVEDVSFDVPRGEVAAIIGRNGAGKSTLLKLLARITTPTRGMADLYGRVGSLLEVGTGFHPELTGRENIYLNGAILGMRRDEVARNFDAIVAFSGVERFLDTPVKRYSSGMYVRLAFAVAAHLETEILFVDEVLAVGDAEFQRKCLDKMQSVVRDGRTILFVSHNMAAVKALCQRALLLEQGRLVLDGAVNDVVDRYLTAGKARGEDGLVPDEAVRTGSGEGRLRRVAIRDAQGEPTAQVYLGEPFSVTLTFEVARPVDDAIVTVGISSLDGIRVATSFNTDGGAPAWSLAPGWHSVTIDIDVVLLPRRYTLDVALVRSDGYEIDYVQQVIDFTALDVAREGPDSYRWPTVHGYVRLRGTWRLEPAASRIAP
jgi:lipopolysaccharide transport system ATP-binding protein